MLNAWKQALYSLLFTYEKEHIDFGPDGSNYNFNHIDNERFLEFKEKIG